ncbi:MAG: hypothetical protein AMXMBFR84_06460 [Candidatus Hydrogenedentota bacterium]
MKTLPIAAIAVLVLSLCVASAGAQTPNSDQPLKDTVITARIETMFLLNGDLNPFKINTTTNEGVVSLTGTVQEEADKDLAERLALTVKDVKSVVNNLNVDRSVEINTTNAEWRQSVEDAALNSRIRRRLAYHSGIDDALLNIDVNAGEVTLKGDVESPEKKETVEKIVSDTSGVGAVDSQLTVGKTQVAAEADTVTETVTTEISDEFAEKMVESSIMWSKDLSIYDIDVEVDHGVCVLTGKVATVHQKDLAESIAKVTDGISAVTNELVLEGA